MVPNKLYGHWMQNFDKEFDSNSAMIDLLVEADTPHLLRLTNRQWQTTQTVEIHASNTLI